MPPQGAPVGAGVGRVPSQALKREAPFIQKLVSQHGLLLAVLIFFGDDFLVNKELLFIYGSFWMGR